MLKANNRGNILVGIGFSIALILKPMGVQIAQRKMSCVCVQLIGLGTAMLLLMLNAANVWL